MKHRPKSAAPRAKPAKGDRVLQDRVLRDRVLRGRVWVEINGKPAMTDAGADLLEQINVCGSLSEAARRLHYSYRRAWLLLDAMNRRWPSPLATTATGGRKGGGAKITELGQGVLNAYRDLQLQIEHLLGAAGDPFKHLF